MIARKFTFCGYPDLQVIDLLAFAHVDNLVIKETLSVKRRAGNRCLKIHVLKVPCTIPIFSFSLDRKWRHRVKTNINFFRSEEFVFSFRQNDILIPFFLGLNEKINRNCSLWSSELKFDKIERNWSIPNYLAFFQTDF